jgi:hypothetical protein
MGLKTLRFVLRPILVFRIEALSRRSEPDEVGLFDQQDLCMRRRGVNRRARQFTGRARRAAKV